LLKLKLEEIANEDSPKNLDSSHSKSGQVNRAFFIELDRKQIVHILLYRGDTDRVNAYRGTPLTGVHHYEFRSPECTHTYLKIEGSSIPSRQGTFRFKEDGTLTYQNECNHGTLLIPGGTTASQNPIYGEYHPTPGDQFLIGFPRSRHRFRATILKS
jgi:hypothetical protein